jgi:hypothetical protein
MHGGPSRLAAPLASVQAATLGFCRAVEVACPKIAAARAPFVPLSLRS